jgi:hypothetical protein
MNTDERIKNGFEHAANVVKQVLTLSTAIVTITAAAARFVFDGAPDCASKWLIMSWGVFIVSIVFGVMGLMSLAGDMAPKALNDESPNPSIYNKSTRFCVIAQLVFFLFGLLFVIVYGCFANG